MADRRSGNRGGRPGGPGGPRPNRGGGDRPPGQWRPNRGEGHPPHGEWRPNRGESGTGGYGTGPGDHGPRPAGDGTHGPRAFGRPGGGPDRPREPWRAGGPGRPPRGGFQGPVRRGGFEQRPEPGGFGGPGRVGGFGFGGAGSRSRDATPDARPGADRSGMHGPGAFGPGPRGAGSGGERPGWNRGGPGPGRDSDMRPGRGRAGPPGGRQEPPWRGPRDVEPGMTRDDRAPQHPPRREPEAWTGPGQDRGPRERPAPWERRSGADNRARRDARGADEGRGPGGASWERGGAPADRWEGRPPRPSRDSGAAGARPWPSGQAEPWRGPRQRDDETTPRPSWRPGPGEGDRPPASPGDADLLRGAPGPGRGAPGEPRLAAPGGRPGLDDRRQGTHADHGRQGWREGGHEGGTWGARAERSAPWGSGGEPDEPRAREAQPVEHAEGVASAGAEEATWALVGTDEEIVAGRRPVEEAFAARREARRLLVVPQRRDALEALVLQATRLRIPVVEVEGGTLTSVTGFDGHQGIALVVAPRRWASLDDVLALAAARSEPPFVLVLDSLEDPQNLGTLLRSADACGIHGVVFPTRNAAPLTPSAVKASAGAVEHLLLVPVDDLPGALADLRARGMHVVGTDAEASLSYRDADLRGPVALVIGSEGKGMTGPVRRRLELLVRIPMRGHVGSLNAAVAGSVLLFEAAAQRPAPPPAGARSEDRHEDERAPGRTATGAPGAAGAAGPVPVKARKAAARRTTPAEPVSAGAAPGEPVSAGAAPGGTCRRRRGPCRTCSRRGPLRGRRDGRDTNERGDRSIGGLRRGDPRDTLPSNPIVHTTPLRGRGRDQPREKPRRGQAPDSRRGREGCSERSVGRVRVRPRSGCRRNDGRPGRDRLAVHGARRGGPGLRARSRPDGHPGTAAVRRRGSAGHRAGGGPAAGTLMPPVVRPAAACARDRPGRPGEPGGESHPPRIRGCVDPSAPDRLARLTAFRARQYHTRCGRAFPEVNSCLACRRSSIGRAAVL